MRWLVVLALVGCGDVITGYKAFTRRAHTGVDFAGNDGDPVLAAADGLVASYLVAPRGVGTCVLLAHHCRDCEPAIYYTSYCHLQRSLVSPGQLVVRGQHIAELGHSGWFSTGFSHLHFSMCSFPCVAATRDGDFLGTFDPMEYSAGCFEPRKSYVPERRPMLTSPIVCSR